MSRMDSQEHGAPLSTEQRRTLSRKSRIMLELCVTRGPRIHGLILFDTSYLASSGQFEGRPPFLPNLVTETMFCDEFAGAFQP